MTTRGNTPALTRVENFGVAYWTDQALLQSTGVVICFSERIGGVSTGPFSSLNLAGHVGDESSRVDSNRARLLAAVGIADSASLLTTADQVHGDTVVVVDDSRAGSGARAADGPPPVQACDGLVTRQPGTPLLMCFADCVPIILACDGGVAVIHAGWRGALAGIPGVGARRLVETCASAPSTVRAYIGAHIGPRRYEVGADIMSQFTGTFGTVARAKSGGLDLGAVVSASLTDAGVDSCNIVRLGACTAETTDRFYSHRAEGGLTGRHGALACILER